MQTSQTGTYKAFTLIELIVAIFIISLTTALIMPSFWSLGEDTLKTEARHMSSILKYIYDEAIGKKQTFLVKFDLDNETWGYQTQKESRNYRLREDIQIKDIVVPSLGEISYGEVTIIFGPMGPEESITIHLQKAESEYTVIFNHLNGKTKIFEGYKVIG
jgi:prepilin-type N-terminal cleavage/methylation domain-containing protein